MTDFKDKHIIDLFKRRDGLETKVELNNGQVLSIWNIAWGHDIGDEFAHITTNISPTVNDVPIDVFYTSEIKRVLDENNREIIITD